MKHLLRNLIILNFSGGSQGVEEVNGAGFFFGGGGNNGKSRSLIKGAIFPFTYVPHFSEDGPCRNYTTLNEAWRKINEDGVSFPGTTANGGGLFCDKPRDGRVTPGWYRFEEPAGTYLPESLPEYDGGRLICRTNIVAWLNGKHPTVHDGIKDREICFRYRDSSCQHSVRGKVRTCEGGNGRFYVYFLDVPPDINCNYAYCAV